MTLTGISQWFFCLCFGLITSDEQGFAFSLKYPLTKIIVSCDKLYSVVFLGHQPWSELREKRSIGLVLPADCSFVRLPRLI